MATSSGRRGSGTTLAVTWPSCTAAPGSRRALDWAGDHEAELNELESAFVAESQAASEAESRRIRRTNRRLRLLLAGAVVFLVAAVAGGSVALFQSVEAQRESDRAARAARIAQAREIASFCARQLRRGSGRQHPRGGRGCRDHASTRRDRAARGIERAQDCARTSFRGRRGSRLRHADRAPPGELTANRARPQRRGLLETRPRHSSGARCRTRSAGSISTSTACPLATVPDVVGSTEEAARSKLDAAGFRVVVAFTTADDGTRRRTAP